MSQQGKIVVKNMSKKATSRFIDLMFSPYGKIVEITVTGVILCLDYFI